MNMENLQPSVIALLILYMIIKDVLAPMVRKITGTDNNNQISTVVLEAKFDTSVKVLETKFDHMKEDIDEIKQTVTTILAKG